MENFLNPKQEGSVNLHKLSNDSLKCLVRNFKTIVAREKKKKLIPYQLWFVARYGNRSIKKGKGKGKKRKRKRKREKKEKVVNSGQFLTFAPRMLHECDFCMPQATLFVFLRVNVLTCVCVYMDIFPSCLKFIFNPPTLITTRMLVPLVKHDSVQTSAEKHLRLIKCGL